MDRILFDRKVLRSPVLYLIVAAIIMLQIYIGISIVKSGKVQVRTLALGLPLMLIWLHSQSDQERFRLLLIAIPLVSLQMPKIPFRFSLSELILIVLAILQIPILKHEGHPISKRLSVLEVMPYALFAIAGLITGIINGGLETWHVVCVIPIVWMYVSSTLVHTSEDAFKLIKMAFIAVLGCLFLIGLANLTGHVLAEFTAGGWRSGGQTIIWGPLKYQFYSTTFGTMIALVFPSVAMLQFRKEESLLWQWFYRFVIILFMFLLIKVAARGATIGALVGTALILGFMTRFKIYQNMMVAILLMAMTLTGPSLLSKLQSTNLKFNMDRLGTVFTFDINKVKGIKNFEYRINTLNLAIAHTRKNPLGCGFGYFWRRYKIDESIVYSALLNGTGIMGIIGFVFIVMQLLLKFVKNFIIESSSQQRELAILGIATLVCGLLTGVSSESVMLGEIHSFVFWAVLAACYSGTRIGQG